MTVFLSIFSTFIQIIFDQDLKSKRVRKTKNIVRKEIYEDAHTLHGEKANIKSMFGKSSFLTIITFPLASWDYINICIYIYIYI